MTSIYTPEPATYAWSESDRQYGRPYTPTEARPGWYDGYSPIDRPNLIGRPDPIPSANSSSLRKTAMVAGMVAAVGGGALLGTFVLANHESAPSPSVYMLPEASGAPVAPPAPAAVPPAPNTVVVPGPASTRTVIVPNRGSAPVPAPAPPAAVPAPPRPANVPPNGKRHFTIVVDGPAKGDLFSFVFKVDGDKLKIDEPKGTGGNDNADARNLVQGSYKKKK